jgi:zinc transport system substrate-binding protein
LSSVAVAAPRVVASIKPLHSLVAGVMDGAGTPVLLVGGGASPHMHALRPSQARQLQRADLVFWIGEGLETFLVKPLSRLRNGRRVVALSGIPGVRLRAGAGHGHGVESGDLHKDMHVWLDPSNAAAMADVISAALAEADPSRAAIYRANARAMRLRLETLDVGLKRMLWPVQSLAFITYHDAYGYLTDRYGLNALKPIAASPEHRPGVARLRHLPRLIDSQGARCVFIEPQYEPAIVRALVRGTDARIAVLDPLGADIPPGKEAYFILMERLADSLVGCLAGPGR